MWINSIRNKYYAKYVTLATRVLFLIYLLRSEGERHWFVFLLIYAFTGWFLYVPWLGIEPETLVYWDAAGEGTYKSSNDKIQGITAMILFSQLLYIMCKIIISYFDTVYSYKWSHILSHNYTQIY